MKTKPNSAAHPRTDELTRESLVKLIGKKVGIDSKQGIVVIDVGEKYLHYKWPSNQEMERIPINEIQRVTYEEVTYYELKRMPEAALKDEAN